MRWRGGLSAAEWVGSERLEGGQGSSVFGKVTSTGLALSWASTLWLCSRATTVREEPLVAYKQSRRRD